MLSDLSDVLTRAEAEGLDLSLMVAEFAVVDGVYHSMMHPCIRRGNRERAYLTLGQVRDRSDALCAQCAKAAKLEGLRLETCVVKIGQILDSLDVQAKGISTFEDLRQASQMDLWHSDGAQFSVLVEWAKRTGAFLPMRKKVALTRERFLPDLHRAMLAEVFTVPAAFRQPGMEVQLAAFDEFTRTHVEVLMERSGWSLIEVRNLQRNSFVQKLAWSVYALGPKVAAVPDLLLPCYERSKTTALDGPIPDDVMEAFKTFYDPNSSGPFKSVQAALAAAYRI